MKKYLLKFIFVFLVITNVSAQNQNIENMLFELPNVIFKKVDSRDSGTMDYELRIKQPIDHTNPDLGYFYQKALFSHKGFQNPTVLVTEGYACYGNWPTELTILLDANQIAVEHRYFGESIPDSIDYDYLNLEQAAADLHYVNQLFRKIYTKGWVSTGISKGGATTIFYRYFYPDDVDVSVPYVAPINTEFEDQRIYTFLDTIGSDECRDKIHHLQVRLLENREKILPLLEYYSKGARLNFSYVTLEEAFEYAVLEYPFSFFQWGHNCDDIPTDTTSIEFITNYLLDVSGVDFFSDKSIEAYGSHYYQSAQEMGYYGYETADFKDLLIALPTDSNPHATFIPGKVEVEFNGDLLKEINSWLPEHANEFIYIYGAMDTWSASAVRPSEDVDALWFFMKDKHHGSARIRNMSEDEKQQLISALERWLDIEIAK
ncbi:MAG: hypothetical protein HQ521_15455 [Bacteroidetes bacterium]|nr:hypothetical protein [Bacteroidota bacterium]